MPIEKQDLVAKRKAVVNDEMYFAAKRKAENYTDSASDLDDALYEEHHGGAYFSADDRDKLRIVLGKNWDIQQQNPTTETPPIFSSNWSPPRVFHKNTIDLAYCGESEEVKASGSFGLTNSVMKEKVVLKTSIGFMDAKHPSTGKTDLSDWLMYIKTGIITTAGASYNPIIHPGKKFYDHYHESINPFTEKELLEKQPAGKAFFAKYKTYYNERMRTITSPNTYDFETLTGENSHLQNSLPSVYGFLRLFANKSLTENDFLDFDNVFTYVKYWIKDLPELDKQVYNVLLQRYPLEALISLFGRIGTEPAGILENSKIIEKIISLNFDNFDANSLISDYYNEYAANISNIEMLKFSLSSQSNRIRALERILTNLVFSPDSLSLMNKVDQYKNYFPSYAEIEFTANIFTSLGDSMKQLMLTKFMSDAILVSLTPTEAQSHFAPFMLQETGADILSSDWGTTWVSSLSGKYYNYSSDQSYEDLSAQAISFASDEVEVTTNKLIDVPHLLESWLSPEKHTLMNQFPDIQGVHLTEQAPATESEFIKGDIRNYTTYFRNDYSEPINLSDDDNLIFKKLFGSAFYAKVLELYNKHKRTYNDIISGAPAYTEDLFYRIEKIQINTSTKEQKVVQNVLIPNTTELDIVKYVDTQMKYSKYATYKYNVYAHRIVFGSSYKYAWVNMDLPPMDDGSIILTNIQKVTLDEDGVVSGIAGLSESQAATLMNGLGKIEHLNGASPASIPPDSGPLADQDNSSRAFEDVTGARGIQTGGETLVDSTDFSATFRVDVEPSIVLLEDKLFSTPEIFIMDKPPVAPDINILPYRAINNRVKFLITGASDRYRDFPISMLDSDNEEFEKIIKAQLSVDGKVEFGSDDPVASFQIFRTRVKPKTYQDFELYDQINTQHYEEMVLPNTKYFYTFRAVDTHGHVSNPTPVYEVELIDEKGAVKPLIRLVDMTPETSKTPIKDCQKYIYIKPTPNQLYFSEDPEVDGVFSDEQKQKKYKMRLTSKGTGKKIDINLTFKKKTN
jgi:hypothetical protein